MSSLCDLSEFEKCINIAKNSFVIGDLQKAERFARKAERMNPNSITAQTILSKFHADSSSSTNNNINNTLRKRQQCQYTAFSADVNKCEAEKCLDLAENALLSGNIDKAERLVLKANRMCPTQRAEDLLNRLKSGNTGILWNRRSAKNPRPASNAYNQGSPKYVANKEEAEKCIEIAQTAFNAKDFNKAEKFLEKAQRFFHTTRARDLMQQILDARQRNPNGDRTFESLSKTPPKVWRQNNATPPKSGGVIPPREPPKAEEKRPPVTNVQQEAIKRVLSAKNDHETLGLNPHASKSDINKAFRKLTILLHPDKNKIVCTKKAFMKLTDAKERLVKLSVN